MDPFLCPTEVEVTFYAEDAIATCKSSVKIEHLHPYPLSFCLPNIT